MSFILTAADVLILFVLLVISVFWLLDSNFTILLNFVLLYVLVGLLIIMIGYEFLGISLLLIYSSGIAIIFIITSMIVGTKHISILSKTTEQPLTDDFNNTYNQIVYGLIYNLFFIALFLTFNFSNDPVSNISNLLSQSSFEGLITYNTLTCTNDTFILGFLIYNQYFSNTIISGFILLSSLIASIYISQN